MAGRIRSIKPELLEDEEVASLSDAAWRLWVSLITMADDYGNCRAGEQILAAHVWQDTSHEVHDHLVECQAKRRIIAYRNNDQPYVHVRNFQKHQRIDNAGKPKVPGPRDQGSTRVRLVSRRHADIQGSPLWISIEPMPLRSVPPAPEEAAPVEERAVSPEAERAAVAESGKVKLESGFDLALRVWNELWPAKYRASYTLSPDTGTNSEHRVLQRVGHLAIQRAKQKGAPSAEEYVRHWIRSYLQDPGQRNWLVDNRHPLRSIERDLNKHGEPPKKRQPPPPPKEDREPAPVLPIESQTERMRAVRQQLDAVTAPQMNPLKEAEDHGRSLPE